MWDLGNTQTRDVRSLGLLSLGWESRAGGSRPRVKLNQSGCASRSPRNLNQKQLLTMDILVLATMKNAAKCDT